MHCWVNPGPSLTPYLGLFLQLSYDEATAFLHQLHRKWKDALSIGVDDRDTVAVKQLEAAVSLYLLKMSSKQDVTDIIQVQRGV